MTFGKEIKYNINWYKNTYPTGVSNVCSPLLFSSIFNTEFFIDRYSAKYKENTGVIINQENILIRDYFETISKRPCEQLNVIETNGKFTVSKETIADIWQDAPHKDEVYIYYLIILGNAGFHKVAVVQTHDKFYYVDSNNQTVFVYEQHELVNQFPYNRLTNLSVLVEPTTPEFVTYKKDDFLHIISE